MIKNQILYNYYCIIDFFFVILHTISLRSNKMKNQKMYEPDDKMIYLIRDNYDLLQSLGCFGISLGFGDKTVREVCDDQNVDTYTCNTCEQAILTILNTSYLSYERSCVRLWMRLIILLVLSFVYMMNMPILSIITCSMKRRMCSHTLIRC